jgi:3-oxoadipate enol-lactonase
MKTFTSRFGGNVTDATAVAAVIWARLLRPRYVRSFSVRLRCFVMQPGPSSRNIVVGVNLVTGPGRCAIVRFVAETMIAVDGGEVWADDSGGDGPPVVLLHPGVGDSRIWEPVLPALTASWRVIRYDARGFGRSPAPTVQFSLVADLITVLDYFGLGRVAIVGCSQGGGSALALAVEHPARVSALVLLCPGVPGYRWPEEPDDELDGEYERALGAGDVEALAGLMQRVWAAAGPTPAVMEQLRSAARAEISSRDLQQHDPPVFDRLGEISVPTSLLVGDADYPPLIEADRHAAARIPGCELTVMPGMDHLPPLREPDLVLRVIRTTLSRAG